MIYPRYLAEFGMLVFFTNISLLEFLLRYLALSIWLQVVQDEKSSQEYPVIVGVPQGSICGHTLFLQYTDDLPDEAICNIAIYADDTTLYSKCDEVSGMWQQLRLAFELESDLRDTVGQGVAC